MSEPAVLSATIDGLNRMLSDTLGPELQRQEAAIEAFLSEAREVRERLHAAVDRTEAELTAPFDAADDGLQQVEALLDSIVVPALEAATSPTSELVQGECAKAEASLGDARQRFVGIHEALAEGRAASEAALSEAERVVAELAQQMVTACQALEQAVKVAIERLDGEGERVDTAVASVEAALGELQELFEQLIEALHSRADDSIQQSDDAVGRMHDDTRRTLDELVGNARDVLEALSAAAKKISEMFDGDVGELLDKVQGLLKIIEQIRPLLEVVEQWT